MNEIHWTLCQNFPERLYTKKPVTISRICQEKTIFNSLPYKFSLATTVFSHSWGPFDRKLRGGRKNGVSYALKNYFLKFHFCWYSVCTYHLRVKTKKQRYYKKVCALPGGSKDWMEFLPTERVGFPLLTQLDKYKTIIIIIIIIPNSNRQSLMPKTLQSQ